jgi:hypothetical protein
MPTWKSDNENNGTGNNITIKSKELDPITTTFTGTINLKVDRPPMNKGSTFCKLLKLKHNKSTKDHLTHEAINERFERVMKL